MRFLCVYRPGTPEDDNPPTQEKIAKRHKLIDEMSKAGVLLATEGCMSSRHGARVGLDSGQFTVTDGPFPETKELIVGYCLLQVKSLAEAVEWNKRFLNAMDTGEVEIRQICDPPG